MAEETTGGNQNTGGENTSSEDQTAQQALAQADAQKNGQNQDGEGTDGKSGAETDWKAEAEKWKSQSREQEKRAKANAEAAKKLQEIEDSKKSETQKLNDALAEREVELQQLKLEKVRRDAAVTAGLPMELIDSITAVDPEEATAQAKRLVSFLKPGGPAANNGQTTNFAQGTRPATQQKASADDWIRQASGRNR